MVNMNESDYQLKKNFLELKEWEAVLEKTDQFFQGVSTLLVIAWELKADFQGLDDAAVQEIEQAKETEGGFAARSEKEPIG